MYILKDDEDFLIVGEVKYCIHQAYVHFNNVIHIIHTRPGRDALKFFKLKQDYPCRCRFSFFNRKENCVIKKINSTKLVSLLYKV
jgi:hypothetical protein